MTQQPGSWPPPMGAPPATSETWTPERVEPVPGTEFGLVQLRVAPITSGLAVGSLGAGIAAVLVATLVLCFGIAGSDADWGVPVSGAFALLSIIAGGGAVALASAARRQIRRSGQGGRVRFVGGGVALAGIWTGSAGAGIALLTLLLVVVLQTS
ncbi:hypothetical protein [Actinoplanes sp. NPDC051494]|uniref:hypothetical protein n=1 Tax=Actinoplanes sp. NPDC051494 TaxID=3363907 RepID=UPI0037A3C5A0